MATRVAVDAMGGDAAPAVVVEGALRAVRGASDRVEIFLFGPERTLHDELAEQHAEEEGITIVDAPETIGMGEAPAAALKGKPQSSIHRGLGALKSGQADAFVSAGNTGAVMAASLLLCGRLPGVLRPTLPGYFPTTEGMAIALDVGANVDVKPEHLVQFAQMGQVFARRVMGIKEPTVALANIGEEPGKGTEAVKAAYDLLAALDDIRFVGNVEGRDLLHHGADVVVCDGFVGNLLLKLGESFSTVLPALTRQEISRQELSQEEAELVRRVLRGALSPFNYEHYGGVPLLGVDGAVLVGHGGSTARAIEQLILRACDVAEHALPQLIAEALS